MFSSKWSWKASLLWFGVSRQTSPLIAVDSFVYDKFAQYLCKTNPTSFDYDILLFVFPEFSIFQFPWKILHSSILILNVSLFSYEFSKLQIPTLKTFLCMGALPTAGSFWWPSLHHLQLTNIFFWGAITRIQYPKFIIQLQLSDTTFFYTLGKNPKSLFKYIVYFFSLQFTQICMLKAWVSVVSVFLLCPIIVHH